MNDKKTMKYATVCSGAEAFGKAWQSMGFESVFHAEIEKNAAAVLKYHYPDTSNHGDFTKIKADTYEPGFIQLLAGGTPCQSFSIAGLRGGLADARGNLTLEFLRLAAKLEPKWILWENVPGVLSADGGRAFGAFLGGLAQLGYGFAYRVLDAQYFGVPQRRRRVFVVGCLGDWRSAAAVLFERESLQGHPAPRREKGESIAGTITESTRRSDRGDGGDNLIPETAGTLTSKSKNSGGGFSTDFYASGGLIPQYIPEIVGQAMSCKWAKGTAGPAGDEHHNLIAFDTTQITSPQNGSNPQSGDACHPLAAQGHAPAIAFKIGQGAKAGGIGAQQECAPTLGASPSGTQQSPGLLQNSSVRRLTPLECERLQGWPDRFTQYGIDEKGRQYELSDSARYRIIGNGWAAPVVNWIAKRIKAVDALKSSV